MRYLNWDALIFPSTSKVPVPEFKTACHVVHDQEFLQTHNNVLLLPTVTSFIPALSAGDAFFISIHSWEGPEPSRYAQSFNKPRGQVLFEARVFIDGQLAGAKIFGRNNEWPALVDTSIEMDKNGDLECLKFPAFHRELLTQSYWNAGDELGRIKIVIAEGFVRDSVSLPFERVKNIVAFSFQHTPLDVLEASSIAWPNPVMWRQVALPAQFLPQNTCPGQLENSPGIETHGHSPRRISLACTGPPPAAQALGPMPPPTLFPRSGTFEQQAFTERSYNPWMGRQPSSDASMPDYSSSASHASYSRRVSEPMSVDKPTDWKTDMQTAGAYESLCEALIPSAPVNTPQNGLDHSSMKYTDETDFQHHGLPIAKSEESTTLAPIHSGINLGGVKSRKENRSVDSLAGGSDLTPGSDRTRKVAQGFNNSSSGAKRQRIITPGTFKPIDEEDEPRSSPTTRKMAQMIADHTVERRVLSGLENGR